MKSYLFLVAAFLFSFTFVNAQSIDEDFEGGSGITTWYGDDCGINTNLPNPYITSGNISGTVLEYNDMGGQYANVRFDVANNFDLSDNYVFSINIYVPSSGITGNSPNQVSMKLQDGTLNEPWVTQSEVIKPIVLDQWQTVTFNFLSDNYINLDGGSPPPTLRTDFNRVLFQVNGENNNDNVLAYIDDIVYEWNIVVDPVFNNLVWADEFDTDGPLNSLKWHHQTQLPNGGSWFNGEIQHYTNRVENTYVQNGQLNLVLKKETFTDQGHTKQYTSARLNSKFAFTYGRVEIRAILPSGVGTWPAMWMLGKNINEDGAYWDQQGFGNTSWPACGEIDIMEHWGSNQNYISSAMHTPSSFGGTINQGGQIVNTASSAFHIYAMEWTEDKIEFSVDGIVHYVYNPAVKDANTWPFDKDAYILLNIAVLPEISPNFTESAMEIDYVRVYQEGPVSVNETNEKLETKFFPNPMQEELTFQVNQVSETPVFVNMFHIDGTLVRSTKKSIEGGQVRLENLGDLPKGLYIVDYESEGLRHSFKVVKN